MSKSTILAKNADFLQKITDISKIKRAFILKVMFYEIHMRVYRMTEFVLKSNYFEFNGKVKNQNFGPVIVTKFVLLYVYIVIDQVETEFLKTQKHKP